MSPRSTPSTGRPDPHPGGPARRPGLPDRARGSNTPQAGSRHASLDPAGIRVPNGPVVGDRIETGSGLPAAGRSRRAGAPGAWRSRSERAGGPTPARDQNLLWRDRHVHQGPPARSRAPALPGLRRRRMARRRIRRHPAGLRPRDGRDPRHGAGLRRGRDPARRSPPPRRPSRPGAAPRRPSAPRSWSAGTP